MTFHFAFIGLTATMLFRAKFSKIIIFQIIDYDFYYLLLAAAALVIEKSTKKSIAITVQWSV